VIFSERDRKLQQARAERKRKRQAERQDVAIAYKPKIPGAQVVSRAAMLPLEFLHFAFRTYIILCRGA
jgi:hypothetical protein